MAKATILPELIKSLGLNNYLFEQEIKAANGSIANLIKKEADISENLILKITLRYPEVSPHWLRTGKGKMLGKPTTQKVLMLAKISEIEDTIAQLKEMVREVKKLV